MKLRLVYREQSLGDEWKRLFSSYFDVDVIGGNICKTECDAVVSPANSFGFMDGGLDRMLSERIGWDLQERLRTEIAKRPIKELLVGEALVLPTGDARVPWLISAPTMRVPMRLRQTVNAYLSMKALLVAALAHDRKPPIRTVAVPGLGTGCGALPPETAAKQMWAAYEEIVLGTANFPEDFGGAQKRHVDLNPDEIDLWNP